MLKGGPDPNNRFTKKYIKAPNNLMTSVINPLPSMDVQVCGCACVNLLRFVMVK